MTHNERMAGLRHDRLQLLYANQIRTRRRIVREAFNASRPTRKAGLSPPYGCWIEWEAEQQGRMPHALL
jgi:hypothetical protein